VSIRPRRSPVDLPPMTSDDELVAWGQELTSRSAPRLRRRRPLEAKPVLDAATVPDAEPVEPEPPTTWTTEALFEDIAERAAAAHRRTRIRRIR